jgi:hypothetical protein
MGIYFDSTTGKEDTQFILKGIEEKIITKDFYWPDFEDLDPKNEKNLVWISLDNPKQHLIHHDYDSFGEIITINGVQGKLTEKGCRYINMCLMKAGKFSTIY